MSIVKKDTRKLTDVNPINFQWEDILFYEMKITWDFAWDIEDMLKWNTHLINFTFDKISYDQDREIFDMWWNFFVIEYVSKKQRNSDMQLLKDKFQEEWKFAKELEQARQVPEIEWYFEFNWKFYIIINWLNKLTQEINSESWVYKWIVINPQKYFEIENEAQKVVWKVDKVMK